MSEQPTPEQRACPKCHSQKLWRDCYSCGGDVDFSDPEDLGPEGCDICKGESGWFQCARCYPEAFDE